MARSLINRRDVLRRIGGAGVSLAVAGSLVRNGFAEDDGDTLAARPLRGKLALIEGAGGNVVVLPGPDGLLLVDSGSQDRAERLQSLLVEQYADAPVRVLFNTHWHLEHTGGNDLMARSKPTIVAHENTRLWMSTKFYVDWQKRRYSPRAAAARPNKTFFSSDPQPLKLPFDKRTAEYGLLPGAHTDGDIYVRFPDLNVIAAGGAAVAGHYPILDYSTGGWIGGLVDATRAIIDLSDDDTLIVPCAGAVLRRSDLERQHSMLSTIRERVEHLALQGKGIDDIVAADITKDFAAHYSGDEALFIANIYRGLWWGSRLRGAVA